MRFRPVSKASATEQASPGMAESGQTVKQSPQAVHFSAFQTGCEKRMLVMSRKTPVAAGMRLMALKGSARLSLGLPPA